MNIMEKLQGYKTKILAVCAIIYAITGFFSGNVDGASAVDMIWTALAALSLHSAINHA